MSYRIRDIVLAGLAMILLWPLALVICMLLWATQKRIFYTQLRPGLHEKPFRMIKFSTLYDVDEGKDEAENQQERLTPVGKILRASSLDEMPQLFNVLKGEMNLVGPRPLLMEYLPLYTEEERRRHSVKPGITGWAQVNGRNAISFKQKFEYDLWYIDHRSYGLDLKIMVMTLFKVFRREGVYIDAQTTAPKYDGTN